MTISGRPFVKALLFAASLGSFAACGKQDPAFKEIEEGANAGDATAKDTGGGSINDHGTKVENPNEVGKGSGENPDSKNQSNTVAGQGQGGGTTGNGNGGNGGEAGTESGFEYELVEMNIVQNRANKVDILWIVDNSGSMKEEQAYLGNNFSKFIQELNANGTDFQTAVTSTDVCDVNTPTDLKKVVCPSNEGSKFHRGAFMGYTGSKVLSNDDSDLINLFKSYTNVGVNGSGFEHGLYASQLALEKTIAGQNESLLRDDAFLSVIVVSDEEDDGIGLGITDAYSGVNYVSQGFTEFKYTDDNLISYLKSIKGNGNFSISTITGTRNADGKMCTSTHSQPKEEGTQYIKAAKKSGGIVQSICANNWDQSLTNLGKDLRSQINQVALEKIPITGSIVVLINGVKTTKWEYLEGTKSIKFAADATPYTGDKIKITYKTAK